MALAANGWLVLRHAAAEMTAKNAEIVEFEARLAIKRARIEGCAKAQGRFAGNIAHEIKTPLTLVLSQIELLATSCTDPAAVRRYAKSIAGDMRHPSDLVDSFLRLARPFAQADTRQHIPVFFHDVVVEAVHRSQPLAYDHGVSIVTVLARLRQRGAGVAGGEAGGESWKARANGPSAQLGRGLRRFIWLRRKRRPLASGRLGNARKSQGAVWLWCSNAAPGPRFATEIGAATGNWGEFLPLGSDAGGEHCGHPPYIEAITASDHSFDLSRLPP